MADYGKKIQSGDAHLGNGTSARYRHIDGSVTTPITVRSGAGRLLRVVINAVGGTLTLKDGTDVIAILSATAGPGTFNYGVYCNTNITVIASATMDATIVFDV